ncbi:MAG: tripartite tricarboxylate transporter permease, partial [Brevibacterium yomogidense]
MVLGPLAESSLRDALLSSNGDYSILVSSWITSILYVVLAGVVFLSLYGKLAQRRKDRGSAMTDVDS